MPILLVAHSISYAYGQSKLANILMSLELATRTRIVGINSNSLHPGAIQTDLLRHVDNFISSIGSETISQILFRIKEIGFNMIAMDVNQGAYNQVSIPFSIKLTRIVALRCHLTRPTKCLRKIFLSCWKGCPPLGVRTKRDTWKTLMEGICSDNQQMEK